MNIKFCLPDLKLNMFLVSLREEFLIKSNQVSVQQYKTALFAIFGLQTENFDSIVVQTSFD